MNSAKFTKKDEGFKCSLCGSLIKPLGYTSRDHCPNCLTSLHVDISPGDRLNECGGLMLPVGIKFDGNKGMVIEYKCKKCGEKHNNKSASDDDFDVILSVMNHTYDLKKFENNK